MRSECADDRPLWPSRSGTVRTEGRSVLRTAGDPSGLSGLAARMVRHTRARSVRIRPRPFADRRTTRGRRARFDGSARCESTSTQDSPPRRAPARAELGRFVHATANRTSPARTPSWRPGRPAASERAHCPTGRRQAAAACRTSTRSSREPDARQRDPTTTCRARPAWCRRGTRRPAARAWRPPSRRRCGDCRCLCSGPRSAGRLAEPAIGLPPRSDPHVARRVEVGVGLTPRSAIDHHERSV